MAAEKVAQASDYKPELWNIPIERIEPGKNPRKYFDEETLSELTESVKNQGIIEAIIVSRLPGDRYRILAGERRWLAAKRAGLTEVPAIIREVKDQIDQLVIAGIENIHRDDLNAMEIANLMQDLSRCGLSYPQIAQRFNKCVGYVEKHLELLNLHPDVQEAVMMQKISRSHANAIGLLEPEKQAVVVKGVMTRKLALLDTQRLVRNVRAEATPSPKKQAKLSPNVLDVQRRLTRRLGCRTELRFRPDSQRGEVRVFFSNYDDFDRFMEIVDP